MAIKLRILHYPDNKKLAALCKEINGEYEYSKFDKIPPAYPCENERLLVAFVKTGKDPANELKMFCGDLTKSRVQNVLFFFDAAPATGKELADLAVKAGAKLAAEPKFIKFPGLFGGFSDDAKKEIKEYIATAYAAVQG